MRGFSIFLATIIVVNCQIDVKQYLTKFGYSDSHSFHERNFNDSLKLFQRTFGLKETGFADEETIKLMETPRCGMRDDNMNAYSASRWRKTDLTYSFDNYTPDMTKADIEELTKEALGFWAEVTPLKFTKKEANGDIVAKFAARSHSDSKGPCFADFDGPGRTLAHGLFPESGRIHFDEDEYFTARSYNGINYLWVAAHELGHSLGLYHDRDPDALMYPYYRSYRPGGTKLHINDIRKIQRLYGERTTGCFDKAPLCKEHRGLCDDHSEYGEKWAKEYCNKTCGYCKDDN